MDETTLETHKVNLNALGIKQVRKIGVTRRSTSGVYMFRKSISTPYESSLERDFIIRAEFFLYVAEVIPQPVEIPFVEPGGRKNTYTPDFLTLYRLGSNSLGEYTKPLLVEVKPSEEWRKHWRAWLPKWKAAYRFAKDNDWEFRIFDEDRIRDQVFKNINFLKRYKRMQFPEDISEWVVNGVLERGTMSLDYMISLFFREHRRASGIAHIWHLLATRRITCDITRPLNNFTEMWVPDA